MARPEGLPKTGGRKLGTSNRKTLFLKETLESLGHELPTRIIALLPQLSPDRQMDVYLELMQYIYPKRKAVAFELEQSSHSIDDFTSEEREAEIDRLLKIRELIKGSDLTHE